MHCKNNTHALYKKALKATHVAIFPVVLTFFVLFANVTMGQHVTVHGNVYGGGNLANVGGSSTVLVDQPGADLKNDVYGGGALADVTGSSTVNVTHGTITGNVYGGGLGRKAENEVPAVAAEVGGVVTVNIGATDGAATPTYTGEATINGSVFGCNNTNGSPKDDVFVNIYKTARGEKQAADYTGNDREYALSQVFGGGNQAHYQPDDGKKTTVHIYTCDNTIQYVYGGGNAANVGTADDPNTEGDQSVPSATEVILDGGRIEWVFGGGNGKSTPEFTNPGANIYGNTTVTYHAGKLSYIFGGSNEKGDVTGTKTVDIVADGGCAKQIDELYGGSNMAPTTGNVSLTMACPTSSWSDGFKISKVFGGSRKADITGDVTLNIEGGTYDYVFGGNNEDGTIGGDVTLNLKGGTINQAAFGGNKGGGSISGNITVNVEDAGNSCPLIVKDVFGAGDQAVYHPTNSDVRENNPVVYINHLRDGQSITGNVYGGGNGDPSDLSQEPGMVTGDPKVVIGDVTEGHNAYRAAISGNVYGGGNAAKVDGTTTVLMQKDNSTVAQNIFGGGNLANVTGATDVDINGGTVSLDVYGGGALANTGATSVTLASGTVSGSLYGGGLGDNSHAAMVNGTATVLVNGGKVEGAVYGCNNVNGSPTGGVSVTINGSDPTQDILDGNGDKIGDLYAIKGVYGGGNQAAYTHTAAPVVVVNGCATSIKDVFGGGNAAPVPATNVTINGGDIYRVFAGGNGESGTPAHVGYNTTSMTPSDSYGAGTASLTITNGSIQQVFGGSNARGNIRESSSIEVEKGSAPGCEMHISQLFGGGNKAAGKAATINIGCTGIYETDEDKDGDGKTETQEGIGQLYGGANEANVDGNILLNITGGSISEIFGGNNQSGNINGTITINVEITNTACDNHIGNVYGGGNQASYTPPTPDFPVINIKHGTVWGSVFGGGFGDPTHATSLGVVTGNPKITIGDNNNAHQVTIKGSVFGGGANGDVNGVPVVHVINKCNTKIGTYTIDPDDGSTYFADGVYGGGDAANVNGTNVTIEGGTIGQVFGGGHGIQADPANEDPGVSAQVVGDVNVAINGGTIGQVFAGSNLNGNIAGTVGLEINKTSTCAMKIGEVYGGGNEAAGNAGSISIGCTGSWSTTGTNNHTNHNSTTNRIGYQLEGIGTVYGGANKANVNNSIGLNINSGIVEYVFGGNNTSGAISGTIQVNINKTGTCDWYVGDVYGGGNHAPYGGTPDVNIIAGIVSGNVYGGGNDITTDAPASPVGVAGSDVEMTGGTVLGGIYGGCNLKGSVTGSSLVKIYGGTVGSVDSRADVFGGGLGQNTKVLGNVTVNVNVGSGVTTAPVIYGDVYGGSAKGLVNCTGEGNAQNGSSATEVTLTAGTINGDLYGGGLGDNTYSANVWGPVTVKVNGGSVAQYTIGVEQKGGNVYGCNNVKGAPQISSQVEINEGSVAHDVFGGGNLANATIATYVKINGGTVNGDVYGGGALANTGNTVVDVLAGSVHDVFGGGLGDGSHSPTVGTATVNIGSGTVATTGEYKGYTTGENTGSATIGGNVYGCNNAAGSPTDNVTVNIFKTAHTAGVNEVGDGGYAIANVFGGGNEANFTVAGKTATVNVYGCDNTINRVFGGGNAAATNTVSTFIQGGRINQVFGGGNGEVTAANVNGNVNLAIHGGNVTQFFGASNQQGTISGQVNLIVDDASPCGGNLTIDEFFCGGNFADIFGDLQTDITCSEGMKVNNLYGGCNMANIYGNVVLNLYGGEYENVFGGSKGDLASLGDNHNDKSADIKKLPTDEPESGTPLHTYWSSNPLLRGQGGNVTLNLYGGKITNDVFGGSNINGNIEGVIKVNVLDFQSNDCPLIVNNIYGGCNLTAYTPNEVSSGVKPTSPVVNVIHIKSGNSISGNIFGGSKGGVIDNTTYTAAVTSNPQVNIGYDQASMASEIPTGYHVSISNYKAAVSGNVYGGGNLAPVDGGTTVTLRKNNSPDAVTSVAGDVYGGGNLASVSGSTVVNVTGGTVTNDVYGGGALADVNVTAGEHTSGATTSVTLSGGKVRNLYGGGLGRNADNNVTAVAAKVYGPVTVTVNSGSVTNVFGCNNYNGAPQSAVSVNINNNVGGNVYGGGNMAAASVSPAVCINKGTVTGSVFGGGLGSTAVITGSPTVTVGDLSEGHGSYTAIVNGDVYGGGDAAEVKGTTSVTIQKCNTIVDGDVYGGGNAADITMNNGVGGTTSVTVTGGTINGTGHGRVFGGGHGNKDATPNPVSANVAADVTVNIQGGTISKVFGGSNSMGNISGEVDVNINKGATACDMHIEEVYGGGNEAAGNAGSVNIVCTGDESKGEGINYVYGGANAADINSDITLNIRGGRINNIFGGNNTSGAISGKITVNINKKDDASCASDWYVGNVFGGGNQATYTHTTANENYPAVNILNGLVSGDVFGGGLGLADDATKGVVTGNPRVVVNGANASVAGGVYGGGSLAPTTGNPMVTMTNGALVNVYGGGKAANVTGNPTVSIDGGTVSTGVYGGCDSKGTVSGNIVVNVTGGAIGGASRANVYGGGYGDQTSTTGDVTVTFGAQSTTQSDAPLLTGDLYGGSALGNVGASGKTTTVNVINGKIIGDVYGGGLGNNDHAAAVNGNVEVNVGKTIENTLYNVATLATYNEGAKGGNVFGCNNENGAPTGTVLVNYNGGTVTNVFGGGNLAQYTGSPTVNINNGTVSGNVYGGGKGQLLSSTDSQHGQKGKVTGNPSVTIGNDTDGQTAHVTGDVYGGGDAANVDGTPVIVVNDCNTTIGNLYGGGNAADVSGTSITVNAVGSIAQAFGGGHGDKNVTVEPLKYANVNGDVSFAVHGGTITQVFAGSNSKGSITGSSSLTVDKTGNCPMKIAEVYGGGNEADGNAGTINIGCTGQWTSSHENHNSTDNRIGYELEGISAVYGGANQAAIGTSSSPSDITLNITSGIVENVFGGNNTSGVINGNITVNINKDKDKSCSWYVGNVYGGGNEAAYTNSGNYPAVNILNGTVSGSVFGGGKGGGAKVVGRPTVTLGDDAHGTNVAVVSGNVYGGGDAAEVEGSTQVNVCQSHSTAVNVFGGGNLATVSETSEVIMTNGAVSANVYGGGNQAAVGSSAVSMSGGSADNVFGGGNQAGSSKTDGTTVVTVSGTASITTGLYGGCNAGGTINGAITVNANGGTIPTIFGGGFGQPTATAGNVDVLIAGATVSGDVYGGSALGSVGGSAVNTTNHANVTMTSGTVSGDIYGGGLGQVTPEVEAKVYCPVKVTINGGTVTGGVFGCNNLKGSPLSTVQVDIDETTPGTLSVASVFGGGNQAVYSGTPEVNIKKGTVGTVYGGGNEAGVGGGNVTMTDGLVTGAIYGGCNTSGTVTGNITVSVKGGTVGVTGTEASIFGGGYGSGTSTGGNVTVTFGEIKDGDAHSEYPKLYGDIYGGSAKGNVNDDANETTTVNILNGEIYKRIVSSTEEYGGNVYGGGLGDRDNNMPAIVNGQVYVNIGQGTAGNPSTFKGQAKLYDSDVYGCNNVFGSPQQNTYVHVYNSYRGSSDYDTSGTSYAIRSVFGGGNKANYLPDGNGTSFTPSNYRTSKRTQVRVHGCENTIKYVYGGGNAADAVGVEVIIEGGHFDEVFVGGNGLVTAANIGQGGMGSATLGGHANFFYQGSNKQGTYPDEDYRYTPDVANAISCGDWVVDSWFFGDNEAVHVGDLNNTIECNNEVSKFKYLYVYAGSRYAVVYGDVKLTVEGGTIRNLFGGSRGYEGTYAADIRKIPADFNLHYSEYLADASSKYHDLAEWVSNHHTAEYQELWDASFSGTPQYLGKGGNIELTVKGGKIDNVFGGCHINGNVEGTVTVVVNDAQNPNCALTIQNVYGGGDLATCNPLDKTIVSPKVQLVKGTVTGNVFGAGRGSTTDYNAGLVTSNPKVEMQSTFTAVKGNIYGGGEFASVGDFSRTNGSVTALATVNTGLTEIVISGGTVGESASIGSGADYREAGYTKGKKGHVYGGSLGAAGSAYVNYAYVDNTRITITGGTIMGSVFGGGEDGHVLHNAGVYVSGNAVIGQEPASGDLNQTVYFGNIYGGGRGVDKDASDQYSVTAGKVLGNTNVEVSGGRVRHNIYGGGSMASVVPTSGSSSCNVSVSGGIIGSTVGGTTLGGNVYGASRGLEGTTGTMASELAHVYQTNVALSGDIQVRGNVFGGGESGYVNTNTTVNVNGGTVDHGVYGGGALANVAGTATVTLNNGTVNEIYGGGLGEASSNTTATVTGAVQVNVSGGTVGTVYGCNNAHGSPLSTVTVNIDKSTVDGAPAMNVYNVYGGGNQAAYTPTNDAATGNNFSPIVTIANGTVSKQLGAAEGATGNVFGGGNQAAVTSNPKVWIKPADSPREGGTVQGNVYGGGNNGVVNGNPVVIIGDE